MGISFNLTLRRITKSFYLAGSACLLVGGILFFVQPPDIATGAPSKDHFDPGYVFSDETPPDWEYDGSEIITEVQIKSAQGCFPLTISSPNDGCYDATGLGTNHVIVSKIGPDSPSCQDISLVYFFSDQVEPSPTPTNTATNTATPTATSTQLEIDPVVTVTPADTPTPKVTDTPVTPPPTNPPPAATPTEQVPEANPTNPPTIPPPTIPAGTPTPQILIPVTGVDLSYSNPNSGSNFGFYISLGIWLIGIGMVFHGIATHLTRKKSR
jgi:hypothetical protein